MTVYHLERRNGKLTSAMELVLSPGFEPPPVPALPRPWSLSFVDFVIGDFLYLFDDEVRSLVKILDFFSFSFSTVPAVSCEKTAFVTTNLDVAGHDRIFVTFLSSLFPALGGEEFIGVGSLSVQVSKYESESAFFELSSLNLSMLRSTVGTPIVYKIRGYPLAIWI